MVVTLNQLESLKVGLSLFISVRAGEGRIEDYIIFLFFWELSLPPIKFLCLPPPTFFIFILPLIPPSPT